jgi:hypothetical protein
MAFHFNRAAVKQGYVADYGKAKAGSAGVLAAADAVKAFKDAVKVFRGYALAFILYRDNKFPFPCFRLKKHL